MDLPQKEYRETAACGACGTRYAIDFTQHNIPITGKRYLCRQCGSRFIAMPSDLQLIRDCTVEVGHYLAMRKRRGETINIDYDFKRIMVFEKFLAARGIPLGKTGMADKDAFFDHLRESGCDQEMLEGYRCTLSDLFHVLFQSHMAKVNPFAVETDGIEVSARTLLQEMGETQSNTHLLASAEQLGILKELSQRIARLEEKVDQVMLAKDPSD